jgi:hypothetical protein
MRTRQTVVSPSALRNSSPSARNRPPELPLSFLLERTKLSHLPRD